MSDYDNIEIINNNYKYFSFDTLRAVYFILFTTHSYHTMGDNIKNERSRPLICRVLGCY